MQFLRKVPGLNRLFTKKLAKAEESAENTANVLTKAYSKEQIIEGLRGTSSLEEAYICFEEMYRVGREARGTLYDTEIVDLMVCIFKLYPEELTEFYSSLEQESSNLSLLLIQKRAYFDKANWAKIQREEWRFRQYVETILIFEKIKELIRGYIQIADGNSYVIQDLFIPQPHHVLKEYVDFLSREWDHTFKWYISYLPWSGGVIRMSFSPHTQKYSVIDGIWKDIYKPDARPDLVGKSVRDVFAGLGIEVSDK